MYNYDDYFKKEGPKEKEAGCVEINIRCGEKEPRKEEKPWPEKPGYEKEPGGKKGDKKPDDKKESTCVVINIFCADKHDDAKEPEKEKP